MHADFLLVKEDKPITVVLPLVIEGSAPGVMRGGKLKQPIRKIKVSGLAKDLPENITVNISNLNILDSIKVRDLNIEGVTMVTPGYQVIVEVRAARGASVAAEETEE